ncbi:cobalamin-independent methionine synthase II family protein [Enterococcus alcedinis]|uniref:5-methyltetrahydropteroyltriglutamate--homocysteine methyltransferase n=1 Tax=Enterococcus alcedinis TaxID=1274384 RepID=A0A917JGM9_9ENTE|nr:cobalamin-independent methionine synthase II family protein [Enterococcus alcedinis]MBP2102933.1 methionine synthase II (cobalamin-independent) [Enterococcus alcedinis]GGI66406.1 5-methyltetrahydropteroyltriglutamate--homocysteine methyltransferase [Enterococcus alcedinis]
MTAERFQLVGSLLRPTNLLDYKNKIEARDDIQYPFYNDFTGYQETETNEIQKVIEKQIDAKIPVITDGEYSRSMWHLDFVWGFDGIERFIADNGYTFQDFDGGVYETRKDIGIRITKPLSGKNHHFITLYKQLREQAGDHPAKITVWGAAHAFTELAVMNQIYGEDQVYPTQEALKEGLIQAYKEFLVEYKAAGGEIIQFDDCLWELFSEDNEQSFFTAGNNGLEDLADAFIAINNNVADYAHELGLKVWTHNCRGNYESRHAAGGSYESIAEKFLRDQRYDRFFLEWDDERAGELSALEVLKERPNVDVVLGLLSSKTSHLDDEERVYQLLEKASDILPKERLFLSHQCGFASCDGGNELSIDQQWAKINQGQAIAEKFWK